MQINRSSARSASAAYTFIEVMVAVAIIGIMTVVLYAGISISFGVIHRTRENLRATQILVQRVETVRLYSWDQLPFNYKGTPAWFQTNFVDQYDPIGVTNNGGGAVYHGNIRFTVPPPTTVLPTTVSYRTNVALVTVTLRWTNSSGAQLFPHQRTYETLVAKSGMQTYVFGSQ
jgi:prepilin-type N-terminal cleavage/methylation domain-containing protein